MAHEQEYDEFEIELRSAGDGFEARVLTASRGRAGGPFTPPFTSDELADLLVNLERTIRVGAGEARDLVYEDCPAAQRQAVDSMALGRRLFGAVFSGEVERRFRECQVEAERASGTGGRGLRVRLTFDRAEDFALLATPPWELLLDDRQYLALDRRTPVVRSHNQGRSPQRAVAVSPLRVLLADSRPTGFRRLDTKSEMHRIRGALSGQSSIEPVVLAHPNIRTLRERLYDGGFQILHFMGHGGFRRGSKEEFVLWFEGEHGEAEGVTGELLAEFIKDLPQLRLVVINSCWGGALPRRRGQDPFTGVASALMVRDIPAVIAMQFPISDSAAIAFSEVLYRRLSKGDRVGAAVTEGRLEILRRLPGSLEWGTPVLLLSGDDRLFEVPTVLEIETSHSREQEVREVATAQPAGLRPLRLAIHTFRDAFVSTTEPPDDRLDLTPYFAGRHILSASLWQEEVFPRLHAFLMRHATERRPLILDFAAHLTVAFAAGRCLEAKSGLDVTVLQRSQRGTTTWHAEPGPAREGALWLELAARPALESSHDIAMAVSVTWPILEDVERYLIRSRTAVKRIIPMTISPAPGPTAVGDGLHALQLAQSLALEIRRRPADERAATLHLFAAAPNAMLFFLGQLSRGLGRIQLYEHDFENPEPGIYIPSLRLPIDPI